MEHDRILLAWAQMQRRLKGRRSTSKLPELIELLLSRPLVSSGMIEKQFGVTTAGALNLIGQLDLREITGLSNLGNDAGVMAGRVSILNLAFQLGRRFPAESSKVSPARGQSPTALKR
jgi:hypothetical protein